MDNSIAISLVKSEVESRDRQDSYYHGPQSDSSKNFRDDVHYQNIITSKFKSNLNQSKRIWRNLKLMVHGPFPNASGELKNVLTLHDSCSKWILGKIVSTSGTSLDFELAKFVFASMCEYGTY